MIKFLEAYAKQPPVSFHMPGHKGRKIFDDCNMGHIVDRLIDMDITEISGADNLFQPEGIIRGLMDRYKKIYGSRESYILVGGSTSGVLAAIMTCLSRGSKLILPSNCHKSAINALNLIGGVPVYVDPEFVEEFFIAGEISPEKIKKALENNPDAGAVLITSPNYYGICSDVGEIAEITASYGVPLIVDQAHGSHLKILEDSLEERSSYKRGDFPVLDAGSLGADIVIDGTHKTLASFTQTAVVNIYSDRIDLQRFSDFLQMVESSSPSYIMMASLDMNARIIEKYGERLAENWRDNIDDFYRKATSISGLEILSHPRLDKTKLCLSMRKLGLNGRDLFKSLEQRGIMLELYTGEVALALSGIGNTEDDYRKLLEALQDIGKDNDLIDKTSAGSGGSKKENTLKLYSHGEIGKIPISSTEVHYSQAQGLVATIAIIPYPPGIPLIVPGETMTKEKLRYARSLQKKGVKVIGMTPDGYVQGG